MDPFEALGLPRSWRPDPQQVRSAQRRVAAASHPDRFVDPADRAGAQQRVALANHAASELLEPLGGAEAMLRLLAPNPRPAEPRPDPSFLACMIEIRERLDDGGVAAVEEDLSRLERNASSDAQGAFERLASGDGSAWLVAAEAVGRLRSVARARGIGAP